MSEADSVDVGTLAAGQRYRAEFDDCCIRGGFTAVLSAVAHDEYGEVESLAFDNGVDKQRGKT